MRGEKSLLLLLFLIPIVTGFPILQRFLVQSFRRKSPENVDAPDTRRRPLMTPSTSCFVIAVASSSQPYP
jgi:hypothetical protein